MDRRAFMSAAACGLLAGPRMARAQLPAMPLVGFVRSSSIQTVGYLVIAFREGLKGTRYIEGQNVTLDVRSADDHYEKLPGLFAELIHRRAAVLVANEIAARAAKAATTTVPIVFATGGDPVRDKLVESLNRPGGNITGVTFFTTTLGTKKLELVRELVPKATTIGVLENGRDRSGQSERIDVVNAVRAAGQRTVVVNASSAQEIDTAFATLARERAGALVLTGDALFLSRRDTLIALAARYAIPTIYYLRACVTDGGLVSYGASIAEAYRQVGIYAGRILKGERPGKLPVVQPTKFELVINMRTARALGLTIPPPLLALADEVIQ